MRAYLIASGGIFALLVLAHIARLLSEGIMVAFEPIFAASTILGVGMSAWAWRLLMQKKKRDISR
jgi:hypothetical protein